MYQCDHQIMRTTLTLDDDVYAKIEAEARKTGKPYRQVVNELLRQALMSARVSAKSRPFKVRGRPLGRRAGMSYDNIGELLEQLEGPGHP
jgi:Arc/MetJ family transcription regulator